MEELRKKVRDKLIAAKPTKDVNAESDLVCKIIQTVREQIDEYRMYKDRLLIVIPRINNTIPEHIAYITSILFNVGVISIDKTEDLNLELLLRYEKETIQQHWKYLLMLPAFVITDYGMRYWLSIVLNIPSSNIEHAQFITIRSYDANQTYCIKGFISESMTFITGISQMQLTINIKKADEEIKRICEIADNLYSL